LFIISMVPLNFGAAAPFRLKLHFEHVAAVSGFCVPQFGQNTRYLPAAGDGKIPRIPPQARRGA
jgi:hypothetical protein